MIFFPVVAFPSNYYISNIGNDNNSGLSAQLAWQTIDKLNHEFSNILPGDTIFFKRGESFYGSVKVIRSGTPDSSIVFTAYGEGADPVITGFTTIAGWEQKETGIWQAAAPGVMANCNLVTLDGVVQQIGRYPNASAPDGGYLRYESFNVNKSISDNALNNATNWTGAEVVIRKNHWTAERCRVIKQEGNTIIYTYAHAGVNPLLAPNLYPGINGNGYFFQKDARTLDQHGEWFFDSINNRLLMFLADTNAAAHSIKASTVDTLVSTGSRSFLKFINLAFEGANMSAIFNRQGGNISIRHCSFNNIGVKAIHCWDTENVLIEYVGISNVLSNAIQVRSGQKDNVTVSNCVIKNTGPFIGMGSFFDDRDYKAIAVMAKNNVLIENNIVDSSGLTAIQFQGNNVTVRHNYVNFYCYNLDDGGGIYTYVDASREKPGTPFLARSIKENIILNGKGAPQGSVNAGKAEGIYLDGGSMNVEVIGNSIGYVNDKALAFNNPSNITVSNNTCFNNGIGWSASRKNSWQPFGNLDIKNNIFYSLYDHQTQVNFLYAGLNVPDELSIWEAIKLTGDIDNNYYNTVNPFGFNYTFSPVEGKAFVYPSPLTLEHWQDYTAQDVHSKRPVKIIPRYTFQQKLSSNLVKNGEFTKDLNSVNIYGSDTKGKWDHSGVITGDGSLRVETDEAAPGHYALVHGELGSLTAGKKYLFRFNTVGNSDCGMVRAYIRKTLAPDEMLTPVQLHPFGSTKKQHEFLLEPTVSANASYVIEIEKNACTTYLDDIELHEANATTLRPRDWVRFEFNATNAAVEIPLEKNYVGVDGAAYSGTLTLQPFSSKILIAATLD
ncbi:MAG: right-handed parallel beta-helix repeat-containing protein [Chitinophagaceae bacterium]|nr:right-handed parallel beta-helix repeat-containing protein [Chitinophagaceae bacterium]